MGSNLPAPWRHKRRRGGCAGTRGAPPPLLSHFVRELGAACLPPPNVPRPFVRRTRVDSSSEPVQEVAVFRKHQYGSTSSERNALVVRDTTRGATPRHLACSDALTNAGIVELPSSAWASDIPNPVPLLVAKAVVAGSLMRSSPPSSPPAGAPRRLPSGPRDAAPGPRSGRHEAGSTRG
jgi:hypothetical protein